MKSKERERKEGNGGGRRSTAAGEAVLLPFRLLYILSFCPINERINKAKTKRKKGSQ